MVTKLITMMLFLVIFTGIGVNAQVYGQVRTIMGTVVDKESGEGLPGVVIRFYCENDNEKEGEYLNIGCVTNLEGKYKVEIPSNARIAKFTMLGYKEEKVTIGQQQNVIDVKMESDGSTVVTPSRFSFRTAEFKEPTGDLQAIRKRYAV